jgi:hexosaminidase
MKTLLRKTFRGALAITILCLVTTAGAESRGLENNYGIIPMPYSIEAKAGKPFQINAETVIVYQGKEQKTSAKYLQERIAGSTGMKLALKKSGSSNAIVLRVEPEVVGFAEKDAYTFESSKDRITITGKSASGLFYGVQTLFQLLPPGIYSDTPVKDMSLSVEALLIKDKPSMSRIRGLHVDIARHFRTKEELKKIIDGMAMHKLNTLHIHLSDTQGWRVEIKAWPKLTTVGAIGSKSDPNAPATFLTQKELKELCAYAADRYVGIIPEIDMPGHMGAAIRAYPELNHPKDVKNKMYAIRGDAMGRDFAKKVLTEINELFDPEYIHIGVDEVNFGAKAELYTEAELVDFTREVTTFIKEELGKTPIVWDDIFVHGLHDKDMVVQWWRYGKNFWWRNLELPVDEELNQRQQPFILSPAYWTYFDMPNLAPKKGWAKPISTAEVYNWDPFVDMYGVNEHTRELALGAIACTWSERIITMMDFGDRTFPRLAAYSERLWSGGRSENPSVLDWKDYRDKVLIPYQLDRYDALGVWYWSKDKPELLLNLPDARKRLLHAQTEESSVKVMSYNIYRGGTMRGQCPTISIAVARCVGNPCPKRSR